MMKSLGSGFVVTILLFASAAGLGAQALHNTITFDNQSDEPALVKLVGPTAQTVDVPHGEKRMVTVAAGEYYLLARYGADPSHYTYARGNPFTVEETTTQSSVITMTLHKVIGGNYPSHAASREEFAQAPMPAPKTPPNQPAPKIVVTGTLVRGDGAPVAGKVVYLFQLRSNRPALDIREGKLANPAGETEATGQFVIKADRSYVPAGQEMTVGARNPLGEITILWSRQYGAKLILSFDEATREFDVGRVSMER